MAEERCIHEMIIGTCAICLKLQDPDEEEREWVLSETNSD